ncbi:DNA-sulfur modification-associated family protein [Clostridium botulinum 202F]|nr:DNA-sulfur modification-associated family protein [Clostridium botulinum 202F]KAI3345606.1 DNA sulfur modification protein DndB [Clostridium botulinum]KON11714.1 hypothetical protein ACP50_15505 [Clostridium botulinum]MBY6988129.1 DNA sulfur modification protein DndB [Clostridium botulinum]NFH00844.1 hypothetical protein [Clostridium botulinum]
MNQKQLTFETKDFFEQKESQNTHSTLKEIDGDLYLKALIFKQSSRIVYRCALSFEDVKNLCIHTSVKPKDDKNVILNLKNIKNRYLELPHGKEITSYVKKNISTFILPNLTAVVPTPFTIRSIIEENKYITTEVYNELYADNGCIFGYIKIPSGTTFSICDGNHRTYSIHKIIDEGILTSDIDGLFIGIDFYLEVDKEKEKEIFVMLNTTKSMDSSVIALLNQNNPISLAAKSLLGITENYRYAINVFYPENNHYMGIDLVNDNPSKSNNTLSFNMLKNLISIITLGQLNGDKKFDELYSKDIINYVSLMKKISQFLNYIFDNCEPFNKIDSSQSNVKSLRDDYISMSGAGLYTIAKIGHIGVKNPNINMEILAKAICELDWRKNLDGNANPLFVGGILTSKGKISNNRTALSTTSDKIRGLLKLTDKDIEKLSKKSK